MNRLIKSPVGMLVGVVVFGIAVSLTVLLRSPQIVSLAITPLSQKPSHDDPVILTVLNQDGGMVCNLDEYTLLRVYLSGRMEGDGYSENTIKSCQRERRTSMLDDEQLARLRTALEQRALLNCRDKYPQYAIYTDTYTHSLITFGIGKKNKRIALTNPELDDGRNTANYPGPLVKLLREIEQARKHFRFLYE